MESDSPVSAAAAAGCDEAAPEDVCAAEDDCSPEPAGSVMVILIICASFSFAADDAPDDAADCAAEEDPLSVWFDFTVYHSLPHFTRNLL